MPPERSNTYAFRLLASALFGLAGFVITMTGIIGGIWAAEWDRLIPFGIGLSTVASELDPQLRVPWQFRALGAGVAAAGLWPWPI